MFIQVSFYICYLYLFVLVSVVSVAYICSCYEITEKLEHIEKNNNKEANPS